MPLRSRLDIHAPRRAMRRSRETVRHLAAIGVCTPPQTSVLPTWVYPSTVRDAQARLLAALDGTQASAAACTALDATTRAGWDAFYRAASAFAQENPGYFGLGSRMDQVQAYGYQLCQWQEKIASACALSVPTYSPEQGNVSDFKNLVPWIAVAVIVGGVAYAFGPAIRAWARRAA